MEKKIQIYLFTLVLVLKNWDLYLDWDIRKHCGKSRHCQCRAVNVT